MEELIQVVFFAVIILASVAEGAARKRKEARSRAEEASRAEAGYSEPDSDLTLYEGEFEDEDEELEVERTGATERAESMIPADLWEEITALARGEDPRPVEPPPPEPEPVRPPPSAWEQSRTGSKISQTAEPVLSRTQSDWSETESKSWGRIEKSAAGATHSHAITHPHELSEVASVKVIHSRGGSVLPLGDRAALRQAFLLKEVLSSPRGLAAPGRLPMEDE